MEGRDGEDAQASHGQLCGTGSEAQQAFGIGRFAALKTGQVASTAEQIYMKALQVLLPEEDLTGRPGTRCQISDYTRWLLIKL